MKWINLTTENQLHNILKKSFEATQVIYKHSYACGISTVAKIRLEKNSAPDGIDFHFLDVLQYRSLSQLIASELKVHHESPQVLVIKNGLCIYTESHMSIRMDDIRLRSLAA